MTGRSSLRVRPVQETLEVARRVGRDVGVLRVTDITRLDRVGVPVFTGIRPDPQPGRLCVSAGKGLTSEDAEVGAWMEAIETAFSEHARLERRLVEARLGDVLGGVTSPEELAPMRPVGRIDSLDQVATCIEARSLEGDDRVLLPAELVAFPDARRWQGRRFFETTTNGLASGNTFEEAVLHALCELVERDVLSFYDAAPAASDRSRPVDPASLSGPLQEVVARIREAELLLAMRALPNEFGLPTFVAALFDPRVAIGVHQGSGTHPDAEIALTRAVCEAVQSRLSTIHGARDDLKDRLADRFAALPSEAPHALRAKLEATYARGEAVSLNDLAPAPRSLDVTEALSMVKAALVARRFETILTVDCSDPRAPLAVVRVVVPGLECSGLSDAAIGPRMREFLGKNTDV